MVALTRPSITLYVHRLPYWYLDLTLSGLKVSFGFVVTSDEIDFDEFEQKPLLPLAPISYKTHETHFVFGNLGLILASGEGLFYLK